MDEKACSVKKLFLEIPEDCHRLLRWLTLNQDGRPVSNLEGIDRPRQGLRFIVWSVDLLAVGLVLRRLLPGLLLTILLASPSGARENPDVAIRTVGAEYRLSGTLRVPADRGALWSALTDYDQLATFIEPLTRSRSLEVNDDGSRLVEQISFVKVLLIKRESRVVLLMKEFPQTRIVSALVEGDFITYHAVWELESAEEEAVNLRLEMKVRPKMTGPGWIEKRLWKKGVEKSMTGLRDEAVRRARGGSRRY